MTFKMKLIPCEMEEISMKDIIIDDDTFKGFQYLILSINNKVIIGGTNDLNRIRELYNSYNSTIKAKSRIIKIAEISNKPQYIACNKMPQYINIHELDN